MNNKRTDNNARFSEQYPISKVLEIMGTQPITTHQVKVGLGNCSTGTAKNKLEELLKEGRVTRVRCGQIWLWQKAEPQLNTPHMEVEG